MAALACSLLSPIGGGASALDIDDPLKAIKPVEAPSFFTVNDNRLTYAYMFTGTDPGVAGTTAKQVVAFTHFDAWQYGTNFFNIDLLKSDHNDPAGPCPVTATGCAGVTEIYGLIRSTLGFNQIFDTKAFTMGPLRNVSLEVGADANTKNSYLGSSKRDGVIGLQFALDLPYKGYFNVAPLFYKETNHNAFLTGPLDPDGSTNLRGTWAVETNYYMDLKFLPEQLPLAFSGRAAWYGPKGTGTTNVITNNIPTKTEFNSEQRLTLDVSRMAFGPTRSHLVDVWVAYRYWQNKFGLDHENNVNCRGVKINSCTESSLYSGVSVKF